MWNWFRKRALPKYIYTDSGEVMMGHLLQCVPSDWIVADELRTASRNGAMVVIFAPSLDPAVHFITQFRVLRSHEVYWHFEFHAGIRFDQLEKLVNPRKSIVVNPYKSIREVDPTARMPTLGLRGATIPGSIGATDARIGGTLLIPIDVTRIRLRDVILPSILSFFSRYGNLKAFESALNKDAPQRTKELLVTWPMDYAARAVAAAALVGRSDVRELAASYLSVAESYYSQLGDRPIEQKRKGDFEKWKHKVFNPMLQRIAVNDSQPE